MLHKRKRGGGRQGTRIKHSKKDIIQEGGGCGEDQLMMAQQAQETSQDMDRRQRITLDWCSCHLASSSIGRQFWDMLLGSDAQFRDLITN
jgi:hypothetical protein